MQPDTAQPTRRIVFQGAFGCAVLALAGCGSTSATSTADPSTPSTPSSPTSKPVVLGKVADVPVGGGFIDIQHQVVVTQPTKGTFVAFSALCTHQGVLVNQVADGVIQCPAHGSQFAVNDGSVVSGPANRPLGKIEITVKSGEIVATW
ncbi:MAG TPA: Rieske (2Fe-2S) protein [Marmoricola sp.]|nr:Rieske (2Fe-2S) protein [Marmoricola sp.]